VEKRNEDGISPDLPYELQSKMFDQLAAFSLGGAGLTVTLIGSSLRNAPAIVWLAVVEFAIAALVCMAANINLINSLLSGTASHSRSRLMTAIASILIGMGIGSLAMSVYIDGRSGAHTAKRT
jgi:hypothetical protein